MRKTSDNIVISDCRFPNEIRAIRAQGGRVVWVKRGPTPDWFSIAAEAMKGNNDALEWLSEQKIHASEYSWAGTQFDAVIENNGTIEFLYRQLNDLLVNRSLSKPLQDASLLQHS
jgi:hypothetical protein